MSASRARTVGIAIAACVAVFVVSWALERTDGPSEPGIDVERPAVAPPEKPRESKLEGDRLSAASRAPVGGIMAPTEVPEDGHWLELVVREPDGRRLTDPVVQVEIGQASDSMRTVTAGPNGAFLCGPLEPGAWTVRVAGALYEAHDESIEVSATEHVTRRELVLQPWTTITVRIRTSDGQPLSLAAMSAKDLDYTYAVRVVATREPPQSFADLPLTPGMVEFPLGRYRGIGVGGEWSRTAEVTGLPSDAVGELTLNALPAIAAVEHRGRLIATQVVTRGMKEVVFVIDVADLLFSHATMRARILDPITMEPLVLAKVLVADSSARAAQDEFDAPLRAIWSRFARTDPSGRVAVQVPESVAVVVRIDGPAGEAVDYAPWMRRITIPKEGIVDLGDLVLERALRLSGHLLRPDGTSPSQVLELVPFDVLGAGARSTIGSGVAAETLEPARRRTTMWSDSGAFQFTHLEKGRYVLRSAIPPGEYERGFRNVRAPDGVVAGAPRETDEWIPRPRIVDLREGSILDLELPLESAASFTFGAVPPRVAGTVLEVSTSDGLPALERSPWYADTKHYALVPGRYHFRWTLDGRTVEERDAALEAGEQELRLP